MAFDSPTHPNAYRNEAAEKRHQAALLIGEAEGLEAQAEAIDPSPVEKKAPVKKAVAKVASRSKKK